MKMYFSMILLLFGSSLVFYSLSPYYSALGLVIVSISSCLILLQTGVNFLALILLLIYMGGMLVVFMYSSALSTDRFPVMSKMKEIIIFSLFMMIWTSALFKKNNWSKNMTTNISKSMDMEGAAYLFHLSMFPFFVLTGYMLLITLIAVLNISQGKDCATLRAL